MSNDLISRNALKKDFDDRCCGECDVCVFVKDEGGNRACGLIDNAPTVEERPQGEWVAFDITFGRNFYYCTVCKETEDLPPTRWFKFCPNCGADMRGGSDNDPN